jgi:SAM-dependent methyltransferase
MGQEINLLDLYPRSKRPVGERGSSTTDEDRAIARRFDESFFDGDRLHGYGGFNYHPRFWEDTVKRFRDHYNLAPDARILDVGCAKGFMLYEFQKLMPDLQLEGLDVSEYALRTAQPAVKTYLHLGDAKELPYEDDSFDLVISISTVHNLALDECSQSLMEIQRVSRGNSFIYVDAWRNEDERQRFLNWNLTALTYMHRDDWIKHFADIGYDGDYYWFIAE